MLSEIALSPAIFRTASYESSAMADVCLRPLSKAFLDDCIVRDLGGGEWHKQLLEQRGSLDKRGKEFLKKLMQRLAQCPLVGTSTPCNDQEWENEAILSHQEYHQVTGFIFSLESITNRHLGNKLVSCPEKLPNAPFWNSRPCSRRVSRLITSYLELLEPLFKHTNSVMLIDPHLDPSVDRYRDFIGLLTAPALKSRNPKPSIEVHRVSWMGDGREKRSRKEDIERIFRTNLESALRQSGVAVDVFLWDDFHDRFFLTNLIGLSWSNGFDTTIDPSATVTVTKLSRLDLDDVQKEFAENSTRHRLNLKFRIGA